MNKNDILISIICGLSVAWLAVDFFGKIGFIFFVIFPALSILGLWVVKKIGQKIKLIEQVGKYFLIGSFASVVDVKIFQLAFFAFSLLILSKIISFFAATFAKFWFNKHWAFEKHEKDGIKKEMVQFFAITGAGLVLNVAVFYCATKMRVQSFPENIWTELSVIFAAVVVAVWNFSGYKFLVFKK